MIYIYEVMKASYSFIVHQLVHASRSQRGADDIRDGNAGVDIADELWLALASIRSLFQENNLRLLQRQKFG
jgi:hypothetical protein